MKNSEELMLGMVWQRRVGDLNDFSGWGGGDWGAYCTLWAWGGNESGQLGDDTDSTRTAPVQIGSMTTWTSIAAGKSHSIALRNDGTLWAWGQNSHGQVGDGTTTKRTRPTMIGASTTWSSVTAGKMHTVALKRDGTLWAWGDNFNGQLGDGTTTNRKTTTRIGNRSNWKIVAAGGSATVALEDDGTLWGWGEAKVFPEAPSGLSPTEKLSINTKETLSAFMVDFGLVVLETTATKTLEILNNSSSPLSAPELSVSKSAFDVATECNSIPPNGTCLLKISFSPSDEIPQTGHLILDGRRIGLAGIGKRK